MKQIDRFLRVFYKDFPLQRALRIEMDGHLRDESFSG